MQHAKLFAYVNNNIEFTPYREEGIQNVLERKNSMAVLPTGFGKSMCYVSPTLSFWTR
jgi:superfamily II DNA helicase RecQ